MKFNPFLKDVVFTFITSIIVSLSSIIATRLFAQGLGPDEFGAYSLARRVAMLITTFSSLDIGISLARYLGLSQRDPIRSKTYFLASAGIVSCNTLIVVTAGLIMTGPLSLAIFHNRGYESLFQALLFMVAGHSMYTLVYSYHRGIGQMILSNLLQFVLLAVGTLTIGILFAKDGKAAQITFYMGFLFMLALPLLFYISATAVVKIKNLRSIIDSAKEILKYGSPRIVGAFAYQGFFSIGPLLASYFCNLSEVGYVVVGQLLSMMIIETAVGSFSLVALPKAAQLFADNQGDYLKGKSIDLLSIIFQIGLFCSIHLCIWSDLIIEVWLGKGYEGAIPLTRLLTISFIPYMSYTMLKSIIDAIEVRAVNTLNLVIALLVATLTGLLLGIWGFGVVGIVTGIILGLLTLGTLTIKYLCHYYSIKLNELTIFKTLFFNFLLFLPAYGAHQYKIFYSSGFGGLAVVLLGECIMFMIYLYWLRSSGVKWIRHLWDR